MIELYKENHDGDRLIIIGNLTEEEQQNYLNQGYRVQPFNKNGIRVEVVKQCT